jgi:hypothetical protein
MALVNQIDNPNLLSAPAFKFSFTRLPALSYNTFQANLPGVAMTEVEFPNPHTPIYHPGDVLNYETLDINFIVDEDMENYIEIHNWLRQLGFPNTHNEFKEVDGNEFSDCSLTILTNKYNANLRVLFKDAFPIALSELTFDSQVESIEPITATGTFRYTTYEITKL